MQTPKILVEADEIHEFTRKLWRSDFFRDSHDRGGLVFQAIEQFAGLPRFFFWPSEDAENPHFSAWWGGIQMRDYDNPIVHDLYYLHEIWHAGTMVYMPGMEFENFQRKMIDNELEASVISEMAVYYEMPFMRKKTFPYEIFVDRFLFPDGFDKAPDLEKLRRWRINPDILIDQLKLQRRNVMMAQNPDMEDDVAFWIQRFTHQNQIWAHLWYAHYDAVETAMHDLIEDCQTMGRQAAMDKFMTWLTSDEVTKGTDIPFPDEAYAFASTYEMNKEHYRKTFDKANHTTAAPVTYKPVDDKPTGP